MVRFLSSVAALASLALSTTSVSAAAEKLCSIMPASYANAKTDYPNLAFALNAVEEYSIAAWYTDRLSTTDRAGMLKNLTTECAEDTRMTIVVYGIPNKDCNAGYSSGGSVKSTADYKTFLGDLTKAVSDRKVLYVVEPDALGLLAEDGGCGSSAGYLENLKVAIKALSANANAELYVDVGYWTLQYDAQRTKVVTIIKELASAGSLKGITINTSNYRSTNEVKELCTNFQTAIGKTDMTCIIDTSRNYVAPTTTDWCNVLTAGIGHPPTSETGISNLDYFMWIKPPGESDGTCNGGSDAGTFFETGFQKLWDQGYFVKALGKNTIAQGGSTSSQTTDSSASQNTDQGSASQTTETTTQAPTATTATTATPSAAQTQSSSAGEAEATGSSSEETTTATSSTTDTSTTTDTTEAPAQTTGNCKVRRRLRKF